MRIDVPALILSTTVSAYWSGVAVTALVNRWRCGRSSGIRPSNRVERLLWPVWTPLIALWIVLPCLAFRRRHSWLGLAAVFQGHAGVQGLRFVAALVGCICFAATVVCWATLGRNWSLAVVPEQKTELIQSGPYAFVRHPIYALSMALMICSVVVVPTLPMLVLAVLHLHFMTVKARSEEQYLRSLHGGCYSDYCRRTGQFFPE